MSYSLERIGSDDRWVDGVSFTYCGGTLTKNEGSDEERNWSGVRKMRLSNAWCLMRDAPACTVHLRGAAGLLLQHCGFFDAIRSQHGELHWRHLEASCEIEHVNDRVGRSR